MPSISFLPKSRFEREPRHGTLIAFLIFAAFALTACGGGGGGGGSVGASETTESMADTTSPPESTPSTALATDIQAQGFQTAATALPKFGSVTQSSNVDSDGRTTDQASVDFDGTTVEVTVTQEDGATFTFASSDDVWHSGVISPTAAQVPPDQTDVQFSYHVHEASESLYFASYIQRGWGDSGNWYVRGYWLRGGQNPYLHKADVDLGTFIDSPEIDSASPPDLPETGTATYSGDANGVYYHDNADGGREIGQYIGDMTLNIDFATRELDYCTGCTRQTLLYGHYVAPDGATTSAFSGVPNELIYRATATVRDDGTFETENATLTRTENSQRPAVVSSKGSLGGTFSNMPDAAGNPRAVMGTGGGEYEFADGASGAWVGSFLGTTK